MTEKECCPKCNNILRGVWIRPKDNNNSTIRINDYAYCEKCKIIFKLDFKEVI